MKPVNYELLVDELLEQYPLEEHPELYSLYTTMRLHLMKVFHLKNSTAVKLLLHVEERLGLHLVRDNEVTNMKMLNLNKNDDVKKYFRTVYWYNKLPIETVDEIIKKYGDVNCRLVKKFLRGNGDMSEDKFNKFTYAQNYYREHREELKEKKRLYRQKKRLEREML